MILQVVSVKDSAIEAFGRPIFVVALGQATRSFADEINNDKSEMYAHPGDYVLYHLGEYDDATGAFKCDAPRQLSRGSDVKKGAL